MCKLKDEEEIISNWKGAYTKPLVSICCTTFNHELYIKDTLFGFLNQDTDFPFEIIIHDDASSDKTQDILIYFKLKYPKIIKLILQKNNIFSKCKHEPFLNLINHASGKFIACCEGDDYWQDNEKIKKQALFLEENSDVIICYGKARSFHQEFNEFSIAPGSSLSLSSKDLLLNPSINFLTVMFRNVDIKFSHLINSPFGDLSLYMILSFYGRGEFIENIKPSIYRVHNSGVFSKVSLVRKRNMQLQHTRSAFLYCMYSLKFEAMFVYLLRYMKNLISVFILKRRANL